MFRLAVLFIFYFFVPLSVASAVSLIDIDDTTRDKTLQKKYLPKYIQTIFSSRAQYLKEKIEHFNDESNAFVHLGENRLGWQVVADHASRLPENSIGAAIQKLFVDGYTNQLDFFGRDPLVIYKNPTTSLTIKLSNPEDISLYYLHTAKMLEQAYKRLSDNIKKIPLHSKEMQHQLARHLLEPFLRNEEGGIEDLIAIIRVIRPHLPQVQKKLSAQAKNALNIGNNTLKAIKDLQEKELRDTFNQWRILFHNPEIRQAYLAADLLSKIDIDEKSFPLTSVVEEIKPLKEKPSTSDSISSQELNIRKNEQPIASVPPPSQKEKQDAAKKKNKSRKKKVDSAEQRTKTRPSEAQQFLQSLNGLFDDESALDKAKKKMTKTNQTDVPSTSDNNNTFSSKEEHTRRLKILEELLYAENIHSIDVDKTLQLLEYFECIESTTSNHLKMKTKPLELWLDGKRTLIDLPPVETLAINHKSGGKRYFKPYVVKNIRTALFNAGFDKLLKK